MILTTTDYVPGKKVVKILGVVRGNTIRARHLGRDITAGLRNIVGGEIKGYTTMLNDAREEAMKRMETQAKKLKADAVINIRLETVGVMSSAAEVIAYGTAVKLR